MRRYTLSDLDRIAAAKKGFDGETELADGNVVEYGRSLYMLMVMQEKQNFGQGVHEAQLIAPILKKILR